MKTNGLGALSSDLGVASEQVTEDLPETLIPTDVIQRRTLDPDPPEDFSIFDDDTVVIAPDEMMTGDLLWDPAETDTGDISIAHPLHQHTRLIEILKGLLDEGRMFYSNSKRLTTTSEIVEVLVTGGKVFRDPR